MVVRGTCPVCHKDWAMEVNDKQYEAYKKGEYIQKAFPEFSAIKIERLITGICSQECWNDIMWEE